MLYGDSLEMIGRWDELGDGYNGPNVNSRDFIRVQRDESDILAMCWVCDNASRYMILENIMILISRFEYRSVKHLKGCKGSL